MNVGEHSLFLLGVAYLTGQSVVNKNMNSDKTNSLVLILLGVDGEREGMKTTVKINKARERYKEAKNARCYFGKYFLAGLSEGDTEQRSE